MADEYTVLLVDDNVELLEMLAEGLPLAGPFRVLTAEDGMRGLEVYFDARPDCVVIDVKMPELDGNQLVRALRGDQESERTPLVMLTALAQDYDRLRSLFAGADQYLLKPVKPRELAQAILAAISLSQEDRQRKLRTLAAEGPDNPATV